MVLHTATRILGRAEAAQDVHQEVFLAIWQRWAKFDHPIRWPGYLYRTTVHKAIDRVRQEQKWPDSLEVVDQNPVDGTPEPHQHLSAQELQERLRWCIARLPERQAQVFIMSRLEGINQSQIAEHLECAQETVRVHLHRALRNLTDLMREYLEGGAD